MSAHTPREVLAPLVTPILFALVIAPALATMIPTAGHGGVDYRTFVIVGTVGLLIPLTCAFAGIGVIVDRTNGARRELLAAPVPRGLIVTGNLTVAVLTSLLQISALLLAGWARGSRFGFSLAGVAWFVAAAFAFTVLMYSVAEILANRIPTQEEYVGLAPVVAILPWFLAGSLFPITAHARRAGRGRPRPSDHARARSAPLRSRRPARTRVARHLGIRQHGHRGHAEPAGPGGMGRPADDGVDADLPTFGRQLRCETPPMTDDTDAGPKDEEIVSIEAGSDRETGRDQDPVASLRDTEEESGDEGELFDIYDLDEREAREAGVAFDGGTADEPRLN